MKKLSTLLLFLCVFFYTSTAQTTVSLNPLKDNTLFENGTGSLSAGADANVFAGNTQSNLARRAVFMFDVASMIPAGSVIIDATLILNSTLTTSGNDNFDIHLLTADWGEAGSIGGGNGGGQGGTPQTGDATWIHTFYDNQFWNNAGGDFVATPSASTIVGSIGVYSWNDPQMVIDVQNWLDNPATNFGWILIGDEVTPQTAKRFASKDHTNATLWPELSITYMSSCNPSDIPTASTSGSSVCAGDVVNIIVNGNLNDAGYWVLYEDSCGGLPLDSSAAGIFSVTPTATTTYYIRGEGGCVVPGACANLSITPIVVDTSVTATTTTLTANASGAGITYQWINCDTSTPISNATNQNFTPTFNGNFAVQVIDNGCVDTSSCYEMIVIGIEQNNFESLVKIYPNPFYETINIDFPFEIKETYELEIINSSGKKIYSHQTENNMSVKTHGLSPGVYVLRIIDKTNNRIISEKSVVKL